MTKKKKKALTEEQKKALIEYSEKVDKVVKAVVQGVSDQFKDSMDEQTRKEYEQYLKGEN
jgi:hypothetical protein